MFALRHIAFSAVTIASFSMPIVAFAATKTWDGGGVNNLWSTAANWDSDTRPGTGDTILFDGTGKKNALIGNTTFLYSIGEIRMTTANTGTLTVGKAITITKNLSISGGTLAIQGGSQITNKGGWINGGATFTAGTGTVVLAGTGTSSHTLKETNSFRNLSLDEGLIAHWRFDETSGTTALDAGPNAYHLTLLNGPTFSTDVPTLSFTNAGSISFDGINDYAFKDGGVGMRPVRKVTLAGWLKPTSSAAISIPLEYGNNNSYGIVYDEGGEFKPIIYTNTGIFPSTGVIRAPGSWYHTAMTYDGVSLKLYVDGSLVHTTATTGTLSYGGSTAFFVGAYTSGGCCFFKGSIDDVRIYSETALSADHIAALAAGDLYAGSSQYILGSALTVDGTLGIYSGKLDVSSSNYGITSSGAFITNGQLVPRSGTVTLNGIGSNLKMFGSSLYNLTIASAKSAILRAAARVTNVLTISSSAALHLNGNALTATDATITNNGTLTEGTGAVLHNSTFTVPTSAEFGAVIAVSLADDDENIDGTSADTVTVTVGGETVTLTETAVASGVFNGVIRTEHSAVIQGDGIINRGSECALNVSAVHADEQDSTDATTSVVALSYTSDECGTSSSGGGGSGGGGGRGSNTKPTPARTTSPSQMQATPRQTSGVSSRLAAIQKRVDQMQKKIAAAKNPLQKKALQRSLDRLQKTLKRVTK